MRIADFDYHLPETLIAQTPLEPRDASRLLVLDRASGEIEHRHFRDIGAYLRRGDLLVANESKVLPARLYGQKLDSGGAVEVLLLRKLDAVSWEALVRPGRSLRPGTRIVFSGAREWQPGPAKARRVRPSHQGVHVFAEVAARTNDDSGARIIRFDRAIEPLLDDLGVMPLPPYIHTPLAERDRYQTVYAHTPGSAAAPTAGLH
ncbi:MAG: tRNA preQ1(34) S-adenosylmethionine ribosyltransferase-isomerase QueA, partial [Candidatus Chloroheliales bacterium]